MSLYFHGDSGIYILGGFRYPFFPRDSGINIILEIQVFILYWRFKYFHFLGDSGIYNWKFRCLYYLGEISIPFVYSYIIYFLLLFLFIIIIVLCSWLDFFALDYGFP